MSTLKEYLVNDSSEELIEKFETKKYFYISCLLKFHLVMREINKAEIEEMLNFAELTNVKMTHIDPTYRNKIRELRPVEQSPVPPQEEEKDIAA